MPHYEINTRTVSILTQLAQSSEARCRDTTLLVEDLKQRAAEYQANGEEHTDNTKEKCFLLKLLVMYKVFEIFGFSLMIIGQPFSHSFR